MTDFDPFMRSNAASVQARTKSQNRANVVQLKLMGQSHSTGLTNSLLRLFQARPPLEFKPPLEKRKCPPLTGMAHFVSNFAEKGDSEYQPPVQKGETSMEKKARIHTLRVEQGAKKAAEELEKYDPQNDPNIAGDGYKTLFVAKLNYETSEIKIKREFEAYGPIKRVRLVTDLKTNKPRGYAFVEFVHTRDMKAAYKQGDGKKIDNRRVLVDVERGRTVPNWRPRRLGGGLGTTRVRGEDSLQKTAGREIQQSGEQTLSEEPRAQDDQHENRVREKSRERGRDKERVREKSRERSLDRPRDRDHKEDRHHHRDRERNKDRDRERERDGRDRERGHERDRGRDRGKDKGRDRDREHKRPPREEREYDDVDTDHNNNGRSRDKNYDYEYYEHDQVDQDRYDLRDRVQDDQMND